MDWIWKITIVVESVQIDSGIGPLRELEFRSTLTTFVSLESVDGKVPVKEFDWRNKLTKLDSPPKLLGRLVWNLLDCNSKAVREASWPIDVGIVPYSWLLFNEIEVRESTFPIDVGIEPDREYEFKLSDDTIELVQVTPVQLQTDTIGTPWVQFHPVIELLEPRKVV